MSDSQAVETLALKVIVANLAARLIQIESHVVRLPSQSVLDSLVNDCAKTSGNIAITDIHPNDLPAARAEVEAAVRSILGGIRAP